jgi:hypothetical protein
MNAPYRSKIFCKVATTIGDIEGRKGKPEGEGKGVGKQRHQFLYARELRGCDDSTQLAAENG